MPAEAGCTSRCSRSTADRTGSTCCAGPRRGAAEWLAPGGHLLVETSRGQAAVAADAFAAAGL